MFQILTDSCCDLPKQMLTEYAVGCAPLTVHYDDTTVFPDGDMDPVKFYEGVRSGKMPKSAAVNPDQWGKLMRAALERGEDVLVLAMASGISATYQSAVIAADDLAEEFPQRTVKVVDTTQGSLTEGLMVLKAAELRDAGMTAAEAAAWFEEHKKNYCIWLTVEDLMHLKRGGRVSSTTAIVGTMLQVKPLLYLNEEGKLESGPKARGRKASLNALVEKVETLGTPDANDTVVVGHANCPADAEYVAQRLRERCGVKHVIINYIGNVIGTHVGPGAVVVGFVGNSRA
ncbi:MAG: DegV family protein [Oscillospiraceae bacterium]|nr:DegV family protein [Oscillospiraceae bacterium]